MRYFDLNGPAVRERDADGRLIASGYRWAERTGMLVLVVPSIVFVIMGIVAIYDPHAGASKVIVAILAGFIGLPASIWFAVQERGVVFLRDGTISFPHGIPFEFAWRRGFNRKHTEITSIEAMPHKQDHCVVLITTHGETRMVSYNLTAGNARVVSVQLTRALKELRDSMATVESATTTQRARQPAPAWID